MQLELRTHTKKGVKWLLDHDRAALFADMGLGKTSMVLLAGAHKIRNGEIRGMLVIAPLRVAVLQWPNEVAKWSRFRWMRVADLRTKQGVTDFKNGNAEIYTLNFEMIPKFCDEVLPDMNPEDYPVDCLVIDELSKAKNPSSKRIKVLRKFLDHFPFRWGLTGTPMPNGHMDLFAQIRLLDDGALFGKYITHFQKNFLKKENPYSQYSNWIIASDDSRRVLERKLSTIALTLRASDYLRIPPTKVIDYEVSMNSSAQKHYKTFKKDLFLLLQKGGEDFKSIAPIAGVLVRKLCQVTSGAVYGSEENKGEYIELHDAKLKAIEAIRKEHPGEPILVATQFKHEQERILKYFGKSAEVFRSESIDRWNRKEIPILVAHPQSISHGLNLQDGGRITIWTSLTYSREDYDQLNARLARTGQTQETYIYRIIIPGTVDDAIVETLRSKGENQQSLKNTLSNLTRLDRK